MRTILFFLLSCTCSVAQSGLRSPAFVANLKPASAASETTFVTGQTLASAGVDAGFYLGCELLIGGSPVTVTRLGRWTIAGNSQTHSLRLYSDPFGTPALVAAVTVDTAGATPGEFLYGTLSSPVVLSASTSYAFVSDETSGVDQHYQTCTLTHTGIATVQNNLYWAGVSTFGVTGGADNCYCPLSIKYTTP